MRLRSYMLCKACIYRFFRIAEIKKLQGIIFRLKIPNLKNQLRLTQKNLFLIKKSLYTILFFVEIELDPQQYNIYFQD